ncbi:ribosomal RNA processing protein 1 homolog Nnp-1 isoform X1 [Nomia melanderi]|uniref:ribosomal RNA processing protein 1 homolog Nnp-1 isoform X1 n=1 Tax=Nomia melanderi TaxID=2448451 RepID=UPI003FCE34BA
MAVKKTQRCTRAPRKKYTQQILENKKQKEENAENNKNKRTIIIAQEIKFARLLSSNDKRIRDKILKNLRKWLTVRARSSFAFTEADFTRLWKGLFYCMWMSDKPLVQEELAESLSKIVHCFDIKDVVLCYTMCALQTLGTEWFGIDQYRLDKFSMLLRRMIRQAFVKCKERSWDMKWIKGFTEILEKLFLNPKICIGFKMHITEVFLEELSKISSGNVPEDVVTELVKPFITYFIIMDDERQIRHVMRHIFRYLIFQSDVGMDYQEKFQAWKVAGFPSGSIDDIEKIEVSDEEQEHSDTIETDKISQNQLNHNTEKLLDPRAGKVDVELSQIPFNAKKIVALLTQYKYHPSSTTKSRRQLHRLIKEFTELSEGRMPLGIKEINIPNTRKKDTDAKSAAIRLLNFEKVLYSDSTQKNRKRKRNKQVIENERDTFSEEKSEDINDENRTVKADAIENIKKRKKHEITDTCNEVHTNLQVSDMIIHVPQKKENETKEKLSNNCKVDIKDNNYKVKKKSFVVAKNNSEFENVKLKKNKIVTANVSPIKKKGKLKICNRWDVSDNIILSAPATLINSSKESCLKTNKKSGVSLQRRNSRSGLSAWMLPVVKKVESEKNEIVHKLPEQNKVNNFSNSKKRVKIALQRNTAQHTSEYILQVQKSPSIPFDANKKPLVGVLKASPIPSPINPFYRQKC